MTRTDRLIAWLRMPSRKADKDSMWRLNLRQDMSEGYPVRDRFSLHGITHDDLQQLADWLITLPQDLYEPAAEFHQAIERALHEYHKEWGP